MTDEDPFTRRTRDDPTKLLNDLGGALQLAWETARRMADADDEGSFALRLEAMMDEIGERLAE